MSRAIKAALGRMERYVLSPVRPGRRDKIFRGNGVFGMRAPPTPCRDNDRMIRHPSRILDPPMEPKAPKLPPSTDANAKGAALEKLGTYDKYEIAEDDSYNELGYSFSNWKKWHILSAIF
ncbi:hypothetical protein E4U46_000657 [Claviceps purpurea]|nr:hypothetical protein E4U46_000657 [Claviceps purpurea]